MRRIFEEVNSLDKRAYKKFLLSEDILMEHAASFMASFIENNFPKKKSILIVCGSGNNGADGLVLARLLYKRYKIKVFLKEEKQSYMNIIQKKRLDALRIKSSKKIKECDIIVDCLFGTGLNKILYEKDQKLINKLNNFKGIKIACDIPSGINNQGQVINTAFYAHYTLTMGALKNSLFTDIAKDYVGKIEVANLGLQKEFYEKKSNIYLLEEKDLILPLRKNKKNTHKGSFGHLNVVVGCKKGAGIIAAKAAFGFGTGLVSVISHENLDLPYHIMQNHFLSDNCTAIAIGMGLGKFDYEQTKKILHSPLPKIIDADLFYEDLILEILDSNIVLTPHPKEFISLLKISNLADISIEELQNNRFYYVKMFCKKYKKVTLLLKGSNVLIGQNKKIFVNTFGTSALSKGGSGDVLSGLIASLLAQGYNSLKATISASLAHALASSKFKKNDYSLIPSDLIEEVKRL